MSTTSGCRRGTEYAGLFEHAELAVQPGAGHFPWLDDTAWFTRTLALFSADRVEQQRRGHRRPVGGDRAGLRTVHCCDLSDARHRVSASEVERATSAEPRMEPLWSPWLQPVSITAPPGGVDRAPRRRDLLFTRASYIFHSPRGELRSNVRTLAGERATLNAPPAPRSRVEGRGLDGPPALDTRPSVLRRRGGGALSRAVLCVGVVCAGRDEQRGEALGCGSEVSRR